MKLLALSFVIVGQLLGATSQAFCQDKTAGTERLHFSFLFPEGFKGRFEFTASNAQRVSPVGTAGSILQLRGNVEVRTIVCRPTGNVCDKSPFVLEADAVDYNETTGEIQTQGAVRTALVEPSPDRKFSANR